VVIARARLVRRRSSRIDLLSGLFVGPVVDVGEPSVPGCDCGLTAAEHANGVGDVAQCSCYMARVAARTDARQVA
jgi:hypothetical protein